MRFLNERRAPRHTGNYFKVGGGEPFNAHYKPGAGGRKLEPSVCVCVQLHFRIATHTFYFLKEFVLPF